MQFKKYCFLSFLLVLLSYGLFAQQMPDRNWHLRIPFEASIGVNFMNLEGNTGGEITQSIGSFLNANVGATITRKEKWGLGLSAGGILDTYSFSGGNATYDISIAQWRAQGRAFALIPLSNQLETHICANLIAGYTFYTDDYLGNVTNDLTIDSYSFERRAAFIAPSVGIGKRMGKNRMTISVGYQYYLDRSSPAMRTELSTPTSEVIGTSFGDNLALNICFELGFDKKEKPSLPMPRFNFKERENDRLSTLKTKRTFVKLELWDNAEIDGDTISVIVNGKCVLSEYALKREKLKLKINLNKGENEIYIVAHNEGRVSPNTATCVVSLGRKREEIVFRTSLDENDILTVLRE